MSNDQITLKEWSAYLPWGIGVMGNGAKHVLSPRLLADIHGGDYKIKWFPTLRPWDSLTKPITHNGETFEPVEWFEIGDDENESPEYTFGNITLIEYLCKVAEHNNTHDLQFMPYGVIQKLVEWHFDVFGLLGRGLAEPLGEVKTK